MGRHPLPPAKRRTKTILVRLTHGEYAAVQAQAGDCGLSLSTYVRLVLTQRLP